MPLSGNGMLITFMDADPAEERDFNRWYDKEHLVERVGIPGFREARRYVAVSASPRYLNFYTTDTLADLDAPAYRDALQNPTEWSQRHMPRFRNSTRVVALVTASRGQGRGGALAFCRIRPAAEPDGLRDAIASQLAPTIDNDGIISAHLLEADPVLSTPLVRPVNPAADAGDWYVVVEGTDPEVVATVAGPRFGQQATLPHGARAISFGTYRLLWDLAKDELEPAQASR